MKRMRHLIAICLSMFTCVILVASCAPKTDAEKQAEAIKSLPGNQAQYDFKSIEKMSDSPLDGKNLFVLGSSVAYGAASMEQAVGEYLADRFGMNLTKEAVSGTTLVNSDDTSYVARMQKNEYKNQNYDMFLCQLSTNDATKKLPLGSVSAGKTLDSFDTQTITGAIEYIICYANQTWNCPIYFFTGSYYDSPEYSAMVVRLHELASKWDIKVLDIWTDKTFNNISEDQRQLYMNDDIHPTRAGYREWWGPEQEKQLLSYLK